jgi:hypothetical protein
MSRKQREGRKEGRKEEEEEDEEMKVFTLVKSANSFGQNRHA